MIATGFCSDKVEIEVIIEQIELSKKKNKGVQRCRKAIGPLHFLAKRTFLKL
jgi:hypothetical protein